MRALSCSRACVSLSLLSAGLSAGRERRQKADLGALWRPGAFEQVALEAVLVPGEDLHAPVSWRKGPQVPHAQGVVLQITAAGEIQLARRSSW